MKLKSILSGQRHASKDELSDVRESIAGIAKQLQSVYGENLELQEAITELELASEDAGWYKLADQIHRMEFSRDGLDVIVRNSRLYWLKNPLIRRAVDLQCYYVWGQGVSVRSRDSEINEVMQKFLADPANTSVFSSHAARVALERQLQIEGNLFLAFFTTATTGRVVVRKLPFDEMREIICNPQDSDEVWFYRRRWTDDPSKPEKYVALYPDWRYARELNLRGEERPGSYQGLSVRWESPVMHVAVGALSSMRFGVPETYAALDWARAYKECLEDFKKTVKSLSKWAWSLKTGGGKAAVDAAISKLSSTLGTFHGGETNPAPTGGSTFVASSGVDLQSVDVANAYVDPGGFRVLLRQAGAAMGVPECYAADTEVLTEQGFMRHDQWSSGVRIAVYDPDTGQTRWEHPACRVDHYYNGDMVHFHNAQTDILVTPNHRMWTAPNVQWQLLPARAEAPSGRGARQRVLEGASPNVDRSWRIEHASDIYENPRDAGWKFTSAVRFEEPQATGYFETPIGRVDDIAWARFIGYFVSEGSIPQSTCKSGEYRKDGSPIMRTFRRILLAQREGAVLRGMRETLHALGLHFGETTASSGVKNLVIHHKSLWEWLRGHCGVNSATRCIPESLLFAAHSVRRALFDALMDGDGGRSGGSLRYSTTSRVLADQMQLLAISLGYGASVTRETSGGNSIYRVWIRTRITDTSCLRPQHVRLVPYSGLVHCFSVSTGIYVTRRNGRIAVQGNTFFGDASVGTYATASTLDRPTELKFLDRQMLWQDIYSDIAVIVVEAARWSTGDILRGSQRAAIEVDFPPILERDVAEQVSAIVRFATMGNWPVQLLNDGPTLLRLGLTALHVDNIEEIVEKFYPADGSEPKGLRPLPTFVPRDKAGNPAVKAATKTAATSAPQESADALLTQALEDLRRTLYEPEGDGSV